MGSFTDLVGLRSSVFMDRQALASTSSRLLGVDCLEPQMLTSGGGGLSWVRMDLPAGPVRCSTPTAPPAYRVSLRTPQFEMRPSRSDGHGFVTLALGQIRSPQARTYLASRLGNMTSVAACLHLTDSASAAEGEIRTDVWRAWKRCDQLIPTPASMRPT